MYLIDIIFLISGHHFQPYSQVVGPNNTSIWQQVRRTSETRVMPFPESNTEGYTRAAAVFPPTGPLDNLRPPPGALFNLPTGSIAPLGLATAGPNGQDTSGAYVTLQKLDSRGFYPVDHEDLSSGGSLTPVATPTSPTSLASAASIHGKLKLG